MIFDYYDRNFRYELFNRLKDWGKSSPNGRVADELPVYEDDEFGTLCAAEIFVLASCSFCQLPFRDALRNSNTYIDADYSLEERHTDNIQANAYRHSVWNALMLKYHSDTYPSMGTLGEALVDVVNFANAHEQCNISLGNAGDPIIFNGEEKYMLVHLDYRNNLVGRQYIMDNGSVKVKKFLWMTVGYEFEGPSDQTIRNVLKGKADNSVCICSSSMYCIWNVPNSQMIRYGDYAGQEGIANYCYPKSW